jgi:hypothetical protein
MIGWAKPKQSAPRWFSSSSSSSQAAAEATTMTVS